MQCPLCKVDNMRYMNAHFACPECGFARVVIDDDYLAVAAQLIGKMMSNFVVPDTEKLSEIIWTYVPYHLPEVHNFVESIVIHKDTFKATFVKLVIAHAIGLRILAEEEPEYDDINYPEQHTDEQTS